MTQDIEQLAKQLEQHPDYRVLRRLVPGREFNAPVPGQKLSKGIVLDTETTGFDVSHDRVIELGMLAFEFDPVTGVVYRVIDVLDELEDPGFPIPPATTAVHHITDEMVQGHRIDDARVASFLKDASVVIAHNAAFDRPFVEARWPMF
jgi:DNA polymerase-3 subunit epsilon